MSTHRPASVQRTGLGAVLAVLVAAAYFGFLFTGAYAPRLLSVKAIGHIPWSFVLGAGLLVSTVAVMGLYVLVANFADSRVEGRT